MSDKTLLAGLTLNDFDESQDETPLTAANVSEAVLAGCRCKLVGKREGALCAIRRGFTMLEDLQMQLAAFETRELVLMLQGKRSISTEDLCDCFVLPSFWSTEEAHAAGFGESSLPLFFEALLMDSTLFDEPRRFQLFQWCTALGALPFGGLRDNRIKLRLYEGSDENTLPETHTCTHELHLPDYSSPEQLRDRLFMALLHIDDGFWKE